MVSAIPPLTKVVVGLRHLRNVAGQLAKVRNVSAIHDVRSSLVAGHSASHGAFTLIEVLVAMAVTMILLGLVVTIFGLVGTNVSASRAGIEMGDQLRAAQRRLQQDLQGVTAETLPPRRPESGEGYFELIEGPVGSIGPVGPVAGDPKNLGYLRGSWPIPWPCRTKTRILVPTRPWGTPTTF